MSVSPATIAAQPQWRRRYGIVTTPLVGSIEGRIAEELGVRERQVKAAVDLLDGGSTVPFIARYRKEATEMLDDAQLRTLEERLRYLRELEERRTAVLESVREQGKLTEALEAQIRAADPKARLEDIYLPFKPKRRTKAMAAREAGLEPLADTLLADPTQDPQGLPRRPDPGPAGARGRLRHRAGRRRRGRPRRRPRDPGRAVRRGRRPDRRAARADVDPRPAGHPGARGQGGRRRQVRRLLRLLRGLHHPAQPPDPGRVPRREGGGAGAGPGARDR